MNNRSTRARRCSYETLETRRLLAGDVFARIDRGNLIIRGDDAANAIQVAPGAVPGQVVITGLDDFTTNTATRVNGASNGDVTLTGLTGRIDIAMNGGNDMVRITGLTSKGVTADLGRGNDRFTLDDQLVNGDIVIKAGDGDDGVTTQQNTVNGSVSVAMGDGTNDYENQFGSVARDVILTAGRGDDDFEVRTWNIARKLSVNMGGGTNVWTGVSDVVGGRTEYRGGSGTDLVFFALSTLESLDVDLEAGNNDLSIADNVVTGDASLRAGNGNDTFGNPVDPPLKSEFRGSLNTNLGDGTNTVHFGDSAVGRDFTLTTGRGVDTIALPTLTVGGKFAVRTGDGDDDVSLSDTEVAGLLIVDLGGGNNHYESNLGHVGGDARFTAGAGKDEVFIASTTFDRNVSGNLGNGENHFNLGNASAKRVEFEGGKNHDRFKFEAGNVQSITANLGDGDNRVELFAVRVVRDLNYTAGRGNDEFFFEEGICDGNATVNMGDGDNFLRFQYGVGGNVVLRGGRGADNFDVNAINDPLYRSLSVDLGDGANELKLFHVRTTLKAEIKGGKNTDTVNMFDIAFATLFMSLDKGDDTSTIASASVTGKATFDGGQGTDTFNTGNGNPVTYGTLDRKNFEIIQNVS